jgi:hypothetical protein
VTVTTHSEDYAPEPPEHGPVSLDELARRKGVRPVESVDDLAQDGVFDTDEELDAFLDHVAAMRRAEPS